MTRVYEFEFELEKDDLVAYSGYWWSQSRIVGCLFYVLAITLAVGVGAFVPFLFYLVVDHFGGEWPMQLNVLYPIGIATGLFAVCSRLQHTKKTVLDQLASGWTSHDFDEEKSKGRRRMLVSRQEVSLDGEKGQTVRVWDVVSKVAVTDNHVFICADVAFIIPRRIFEDDGEFVEFAAAVEEWASPAVSY